MNKFSLDTQLAGYLLDTTAQNLSPKTQGRVKLGLKLFAEFLGGVEDVRQVTAADLQRFIVALRQRTPWSHPSPPRREEAAPHLLGNRVPGHHGCCS